MAKKEDELHYMPLVQSHWLMATLPLTLDARGALITLVCLQWQAGVLPSDPAALARSCSTSGRAWAAIWKQIQPMLTEVEGGLVYKPIAESRENQLAKVKANRENGKLGGRPKQDATDRVTEIEPDGESYTEPNQNHSVSAGLTDGVTDGVTETEPILELELKPPIGGSEEEDAHALASTPRELRVAANCQHILREVPGIGRCNPGKPERIVEAFRSQPDLPIERWNQAAMAARDILCGFSILGENSVENRTAEWGLRQVLRQVVNQMQGPPAPPHRNLPAQRETAEEALARRMHNSGQAAAGGS